MTVVKETVLDNLSERAQEFIADLKEKLELDSEKDAVIRIMEIFDSACEEAGVPVADALKNVSELWGQKCRVDMLEQGFTCYEFGVMTNKWEMWAKDQKIAHMAMVVFISQRSAGLPPIAVYEPEDDKGPPYEEKALTKHLGGDIGKFLTENKPAIEETIDTIREL